MCERTEQTFIAAVKASRTSNLGFSMDSSSTGHVEVLGLVDTMVSDLRSYNQAREKVYSRVREEIKARDTMPPLIPYYDSDNAEEAASDVDDFDEAAGSWPTASAMQTDVGSAATR